MTITLLQAGLVSVVPSGGASIQVSDGTIGQKGGVIINPLQAKDQGITVAESLWVNLLGSATVGAINGSIELVPGQWFLVPPDANVWVTAATGGHKFTSFFSSNYVVPFPPENVPGTPGGPTGPTTGGGRFTVLGPPFPPEGVTGLTRVIPSYLYQEYSDDEDLQGFVDAQNQCQQDYVDTFNALNLPIYTGPVVQQKLLDWVGSGLYGMARPALSSGQPALMGPLNTWGPNWIFPMWDIAPASTSVFFGLNEILFLSIGDVVITDDDLYRRILTWHLFKGDGNYCSIPWLKRRIWRFLYGVNGTTPSYESTIPGYAEGFIADTEQISISLGVHKNITIRFVLGKRTVTGGALLNMFGPNGFGPAFGVTPPMYADIPLNDLETTYEPYPPLPYMSTFKESLDAGVLEVPFQFNYTCKIG